jgi:hypothetical protein
MCLPNATLGSISLSVAATYGRVAGLPYAFRRNPVENLQRSTEVANMQFER